MGSFTSTPKVAQSAAASSASTTTATTSSTTDTTTDSEDDVATQEEAAEARKKTLLSRDRSRYGTIATGLQGILGTNSSKTASKTLLGQ